MPTCDRRRFVRRSLRYWRRQEYAFRELVVVDSGIEPIVDLLPRDPSVRYQRATPGLSLGAARNLACTAARGAYIAHWDDDDWMAPSRLRHQVGALDASTAQVCGLGTLTYLDRGRARAWRYTPGPHDPPWLAGGTLVYRREAWEGHPFRDVTVGEDGAFLAGLAPDHLLALPDEGWYVAALHAGNTSSRPVGDDRWSPVDPRDLITRMRHLTTCPARQRTARSDPVETLH
jgi:glycosyltransferase involved in cell wall biosynthesis